MAAADLTTDECGLMQELVVVVVFGLEVVVEVEVVCDGVPVKCTSLLLVFGLGGGV